MKAPAHIPVISPARRSIPAAERESGFRIRLRTALVALLLFVVFSTAMVVHLSWNYTAGRNIDGVVSSLNAQTAAAVRHELDSTFHAAEGALEIVRSILFQGAVRPDDEAKREFVFVSVLRSQSALSWLGFGFPDGRYFGARQSENGRIEMLETAGKRADGRRKLRRDLYDAIPGDVFFRQRRFDESRYDAAGANWYRDALASSGNSWSMVRQLADGDEPAAVASTRMVVYGETRGVLMASISFNRLSRFLAGLDLARIGQAVIVDAQGLVVANSSPITEPVQRLADLTDPLAPALRQADGARGQVDGGEAGRIYVTAAQLGTNGWMLLTAVPRSAFTAEIDRNAHRLLLLVLGLAVAGATGAVLLAHRLFIGPVHAIAAELRHVEAFQLSQISHVPTVLSELHDLSAALMRMAGGLTAFGRYIPTDLVRDLLAAGIPPKPGGETREITVLFADLPGFTTLSERCGPAIEPFLTQFLTLATDAIHREGGTVDKFIGDAVMAFWNAPRLDPDHATRACRAAHAIRLAMRSLERPDGQLAGAAIRIGINTGAALVGNVGSQERLSYTAIGDAVNVASRLESLCKEHNVEILLGEGTARLVSADVHIFRLGATPVRGRLGSLDIYELTAA